jgi:hypothetical protein
MEVPPYEVAVKGTSNGAPFMFPEKAPEKDVEAAPIPCPVGAAEVVGAAVRVAPRGRDGDAEPEAVLVTVGVAVPEAPSTERA